MTLIRICKFTETFIKIECEPHISKELGEYFTISIPNASFRKIGTFKRWNGKLRLFKQREKTLLKGLIPYVEAFAKKHGYSIAYSDDSLTFRNNISLFEIEELAKKLNLPFIPHKHQIDSVTHCLRNRRQTLVSPTASGKSLVLYLLTRSLLPATIKDKKKILLIVPTTNLVEQMYSDFQDYSKLNKFPVASYCHRIYEGHSKTTNKPVIISTWQSLATLPPEYFKDFMVVFGDECHLCSAKVLQEIIGNCSNAVYRIGMTGTLQDTKSHRLTIEGLFGGVYKPTTTKTLIEEKKLSEFQIKCILLKHPARMLLDYREELEYLISHDPRNKFIRNLAMSLNNNTLILYELVEKHGLILKDILDKVNSEGRKKVYLVFGGTPVEEVQRIRAEMETRNDIILLASYKKFQMGANIKNLHNIIFASPSKSRIRVCQSIGRELRLHHSKQTAFLFDIADSVCYNANSVNFTLKHFGERVKIYNEERFPHKLYKVDIK